MRGLLTRTLDNGVQTIGKLEMFNEDELLFTCFTLELPWKNNERRVSCIPIGEYDLKKYSSQKYKGVYEVSGVDGRDYILIHKGNYNTDIKGCILVGRELLDINNDGQLDVTSSKATLNKLKLITEYKEFKLEIV